MLFDLQHILFMVISAVVMTLLLIFASIYVKEAKTKNRILLFSALLTVIIHYSSLYVDFFTTGKAEISSNMILAVYPCNVAMWLLLICALWKNKESKAFQIIAQFTFYLGVVGGIVGIVFNEIYSLNPNLLDWNTLKGLVSHVTMLFGCIYLLTGKYIRIRVIENMISLVSGLILLVLDGLFVIGLYRIFNLDPPNTMYLLEAPFQALPWINTYVIGIAAVVVLFIITATYEQIALPKEERWYNKIKVWYQNKQRRI